jgi:anti-sigma regulatory factor (Ser/Thr protein kinase)
MAIDVNGHCSTLVHMTALPAPEHALACAPSLHLDLPMAEQAAALARRALRSSLLAWGITDEDWVYDVLLLCSELVGNAVRHGTPGLALRARLEGAHLTLRVSDGSSMVPAPREDPGESGRGLAIIDALADAWGVSPRADGKCVWVSRALPVSATPGR